ncbi:MAG: NfeD family protein [Ignavibacteriaceae bacterium]|jgi:membrane protein implicated in regulation of membrane protease activity|nr:NfeD family protein [Ignavibacteriaceae bacterium]
MFWELSPPVVWFIFGLIVLLLEIILPGFRLAFFGVGAWIVAIVLLFVDISFSLLLIIFLISSILLIIVLRDKFKTIFIGKKKINEKGSENMDDFEGLTVVVKEEINPPYSGKVELFGTDWVAKSEEKIEKGQVAEIIKKESTILFVKMKS